MTQKTKTNQDVVEEVEAEAVVASTMGQDLRNAVLIVSVLVNLFVFATWVALQVTPQFDAQLSNFLFNN